MGNFASKKVKREPLDAGTATHDTPPPAERRKTRSQAEQEARKTKNQKPKKQCGSSNNNEAVSTHGTITTRNSNYVSSLHTNKKRARISDDDDDKVPTAKRLKKKKPKQYKNWDERYADLCAFRKKYGHARVPSDEEHIALANWLYVQKKRNKPGYYRCSPLSKEQVAKLNRVGVDWNIGKRGGNK